MPIGPVLITGAMRSRPPRQPQKHRRRGPQTRLDGPQTDLCRRSCRVFFIQKTQLDNQTSCHGPCRDVGNIVADSLLAVTEAGGVCDDGKQGLSFETSVKTTVF